MTCIVYYDDIGMSYEEIVAMLPPNTTINIKKYHLIWTTSHWQLIRKPFIAPFRLYLLLIIFVIWLQDTGMKNWTIN